tara:strand:- start:3627 stop:3791 length:165 start_codon:yes stop_codon:yes gene_type:complete
VLWAAIYIRSIKLPDGRGHFLPKCMRYAFSMIRKYGIVIDEYSSVDDLIIRVNP